VSGIAGIVSLDGAPVEPGAIEAMLAAMAHRGPDRRVGWRCGNSALGQALLATTPEATADTQPWVHPNSGCVVVSDCRLDNRPELLRVLGLTHAPVDEIGDAELLHAAWQKWGDDCAEHLLGDFAFAIWDVARQEAFIARDVMGVRPLYYHHSPGRLFVFASETSAILSHPRVPVQVDEGRVADAIVGTLEGINNTCTFYRDIVRLPPAHTLSLRNGQLRLRRYWNVVQSEPRNLPGSEAEWIEALQAHLVKSVRWRLRSSGRVGSMLSGGVDSSAIVALASGLLSGQGRGRLATFSAINSAGDCIESNSAASVIRATGAEATTIDLAVLRGPKILGEHYRKLEEPFDGGMPLIQAMYLAARDASVRCLMDGMPADNLYTTNQHAQRLARRRRWGAAYRWALEDHHAADARNARLLAVKSIAGAWLPSPARRLRNQRLERRYVEEKLIPESLISREFADQVRLSERWSELVADKTNGNETDSSGRAFSGMTAAYITAAIERYGRMAARCGVEPRHPFLDRELIEFHAWLPVELRRRKGWHKWALREAMKDAMPGEVVWRTRAGHLGSAVAMSTLGPALSDNSEFENILGALGSRVDRQKANVAMQHWQATADESAFEALHNAALAGWWLKSLPRVCDSR